MCAVSLHRVLPEEKLRSYPIPGIAATPEDLRWLLDYFTRHFECTTVRDGHERLLAGERPERPLLAVTFDDGQLDNFEHGLPVLQEFGVKATFCVPTDGALRGATLWHDRMGFAAAWLIAQRPEQAASWAQRLALGARASSQASAWVEAAKDLSTEERDRLVRELEADAGGSKVPSWDGFMDEDQLRRLEREGHEVASHSVSHELLPLCHDDQLEREVRVSKRLLEEVLGREVTTFCYPNGSVDERVARAVRDAGYQRAITTAWGHFSAAWDRYLLPRIDMEPEYSRNRAGELSPAQVAYRMSRFHPRFEAAP
jgi:peptidoglycan/xylan/chitin deacetylase (PgdA/CDA1 family)